MINQIEATITKLRQQKPLVLCLTNYVTMDLMANSLLALGAAPIMSVSDNELEELIQISQVININIGTLDQPFISRCQLAMQLAKKYKKPVILDPVGSGASGIRTKTAREFMKYANIIRGNASEVMALLDDEAQSLGVESLNSTIFAMDKAITLGHLLGCTVVVSGEEDFITDGIRQDVLHFGSSLMPLVTGMGCALTAIISAFRAVEVDSYTAARLATAYFGLCGNLAAEKTNKPGTFRSQFIDELYSVNYQAMHSFLDECE